MAKSLRSHLLLFRENWTDSPYKQVGHFMTNALQEPPHLRNFWARTVSNHITVWFLCAELSDEAASATETPSA